MLQRLAFTPLALRLLVLFLMAVLSRGEACACSCVPPPIPAVALKKADAVFVGVVRDVDGPHRIPSGSGGYREAHREFRFEVLGGWKGVHETDLVIRTGPICDYNFTVGGVYLVYASRIRDRNVLTTNQCTRTTSFDEARVDFAILGDPSYAPLAPERWAGRLPPARCPVHPTFRVRLTVDWILEGLPHAVEAQYFAAQGATFPHAGLRLVPAPFLTGSSHAYTLHGSYVCAACREAALEWGFTHGAPCAHREPVLELAVRTPRAFLSERAYRQRFPERDFAFLFDDGRRMRLDTITGRLDRSYGTVADTGLGVVLPDSTLHRLYELMIARRMFDGDEPHPPYPGSAARAGGPACTRMGLFVRAGTIVRQYSWDPARAPRVPRPGDGWADLVEVARAVTDAIAAHPAWRALPPQPKR